VASFQTMPTGRWVSVWSRWDDMTWHDILEVQNALVKSVGSPFAILFTFPLKM
jgi:hypothetical protein